jgi:hypothetical protein
MVLFNALKIKYLHKKALVVFMQVDMCVMYSLISKQINFISCQTVKQF